MRNTHPVKGVIFDLGGTLVCNHPEPDLDRERRQCDAIAAFAAAEHGCAAPEALAARLLALRNEPRGIKKQDLVERLARDTLAQAFREYGIPADEAVIDRAERLLFEPDRRDRRLYPGARDLLNALRSRGLRIGLISNWSSHQIVVDLASGLGIQEYFAPLVSSASFGWLKPHPSIFTHVLETWRLGPQDVVMVGDQLDTDIVGASGLGMRSILVEVEPNPSSAPIGGRVRPTYHVKHLLEIPALLAFR